MTPDPTLLEAVRKAAEATDESDRRLIADVCAAVDSGHTIVDVAKAANVSRPKLYRMLDAGRKGAS